MRFASSMQAAAGAAILAVTAAAGPALGQGAMTAQAVEVHANVGQASYVIEQGITWTYELGAGDVLDFFDLSTTGSPSGGQLNSTAGQVMDENKCNLFHGLPLAPKTRTFGGGTSVTYTPRGAGQHAPRTGWLDAPLGPAGIHIPVVIDDVWIQVQTVVVKNKGPWTIKRGFGLTPGSIQNLRIEVVHEDEIGTASMVLFDQLDDLIAHEVFYGHGDFHFNADNVLKWGNDKAADSILSGQMQALMNLPHDNFPNNNTQVGSRAVLAPLAYTITAPGTYTFKLKGQVAGIDLGAEGVSPQAIDVTLDIIEVNPCP